MPMLQIDKFHGLLSEVKEGFRKGKIKVSRIEEMEECTKELGEMIATGKTIRAFCFSSISPLYYDM